MPPKHGHGQHHGGGQDSSGTSYGDRGISDFMSDLSGAQSHAKQHAASSGDDSLFSSALGMIQQKQGSLANEGVDEESMVNSHKSFFGGGDTGGAATSGGMGGAAAMQALKMFSGGSSGSSGSSGGGQTEFVGLAMGQAAKLFG
jgi:hypothetical protein